MVQKVWGVMLVKMEAASSSETLVTVCQTVEPHISERCVPQQGMS